MLDLEEINSLCSKYIQILNDEGNKIVIIIQSIDFIHKAGYHYNGKR